MRNMKKAFIKDQKEKDLNILTLFGSCYNFHRQLVLKYLD